MLTHKGHSINKKLSSFDEWIMVDPQNFNIPTKRVLESDKSNGIVYKTAPLVIVNCSGVCGCSATSCKLSMKLNHCRLRVFDNVIEYWMEL